MATKGRYAAARRQAGDMVYIPPPRHIKQKLLEKKHFTLKQQEFRKKETVQQESPLEECVNGVDFTAKAVALPMPRSSGNVSPVNVTNLDRFMESVTPFVEARFASEVTRDQRNCDLSLVPFYYLDDLWESFSEWSAYGAGVSLLLNGKEPIEQFYLPSLSGIQLYAGKSWPLSLTKPSSVSGCTNSEVDTRGNFASNLDLQGLARLSLHGNSVASSCSTSGADDAPRLPFFEYLEHEQPYNRRPFTDKISLLASQSPVLSNFKSSDLHLSSWMCVAWYPIYRIPLGSTLQNLDSSFLTFHFLSTQLRTSKPALFHDPNSRTVRGIVDPTPRISLPVFGLASYKLKSSIVSPTTPHECEQEESLLQAADKWLAEMHVRLPDYQFFRSHYSPRR